MLKPELVRAILGCIPNGQFFKVVFVKLNGETRELIGQMGVAKHVKGTGKRNPNPDVIGVYEQSKQEEGGDPPYRSFDINRVISISWGGCKLVEA